MILSDTSIRRPVLAIVMNALLVVFGVLAFERLPVREYPDVDPPVVSVRTTYKGASAEVVETQITQLVESTVSGIEGIRTIRSTSREGSSSVSLEFLLSRDIESAANDVRDRVSRILDNLPDNVDVPQVAKVDADSSPIMWATLTSNQLSPLELTDYADRILADRLATVPGVASIRIGGERRYAMRVWLDRNAMAARQLTVSDIADAIRRENAELPAGRIESAEREFTVRTDARLRTPEQFSRVVVKQADNSFIRLGDVARVEVGAEDDRGGLTVNGRTAVGLGVTKQATANTVEVAEGVKAMLAQMQADLPADVKIDIAYDESVFINQAIHEVFHALGIAILLVVAVVWLFLRSVPATFIPALAIPVSIVATFAVLSALGYSVNVLTLLALVLAIGLVVDDAIIVVENISRRVEEGEPPLLAAFRGARQIGFAVIATTLVLIAVILPLTLLTDNVGRMFREFAVTLGASVAFSAFVALTLTPMLASKLLRSHHSSSEKRGRFFQATERMFDGLQAGYSKLLDAGLRAPIVLGGILLAVAGATVLLFMSTPSELTPVEDRGQFRVSITAPEGASIDATRREVEAVQQILQPYVQQGDVSRILTILNPGFGGSSGVNRAFIMVRLAPWDQRERTQQDLLNEVRPKLSSIPGARISAFAQSGLSRGSSASDVQMVLGGSTYEELAQWRDLMMDALRGYPGITTVQANYDETKPQLRVDIDRNRAADLGLSIQDIGETLETMLGGRAVTRYSERGEEYDVMLQAGDADRRSTRDLTNVFIGSERSGQLVPLASVVTVRDIAGPSELNRFDRLRSITLTATLAGGTTMGEVAEVMQDTARRILPADARISWDGLAREQQDSSSAVYFVFGMALLVAFMVLAAQFESFVLPTVVMLTVPLALFGGLVGIALGGLTINIYTQIGMILLIGLIAKNAILIVEFANELREEGRDIGAAVREAAAIRLRPILMTSIATVFGAIPLALASGAGAESREALGVVIAAGVTLGAVLSLFATPLFYVLLARRVQPVGHVSRKLAELGEQPHAQA